ncbi:hypothetical protein BJY00DRAFT_324175 [Aspergillus carlsbadensis]|nr:hypothetical protein BJY00DRAFT_324175 [Aspergillus carlsbadensis]
MTTMTTTNFPYILGLIMALCALLVGPTPKFDHATGLESPIPGYEIVDLAWDVEISPGGDHVLLNGTIQEIYEQLTAINPDFGIDLSFLDDEEDDDEEEDENIRDYFCFGRWPGTSRRRIEEGVNYLRTVSGSPSMSPGPGSCGRVSCSYDAAIYLCNDNTNYHNLQNWNIVADAASYILTRCISGRDTAGQVFYHDNWNVIVRRDDC